LIIYACYSSEMALDVGLSISFDKEIQKKTDDVNSRKVYVINDEISR
jgi:hypothetical protein